MDVTAKKHSIEHFEFVEGTGSDTNAFVVDPIVEKKLLRKIDLRILPPWVLFEYWTEMEKYVPDSFLFF